MASSSRAPSEFLRPLLVYRGTIGSQHVDGAPRLEVSVGHLLLASPALGDHPLYTHVGSALVAPDAQNPAGSTITDLLTVLRNHFGLSEARFSPLVCADPMVPADVSFVEQWGASTGGLIRHCSQRAFAHILAHVPQLGIPLPEAVPCVVNSMSRDRWRKVIADQMRDHSPHQAPASFLGHQVLLNPPGFLNGCLLESFTAHPSAPLHGLTSDQARASLCDLMLHWLQQSPEEVCALALRTMFCTCHENRPGFLPPTEVVSRVDMSKSVSRYQGSILVFSKQRFWVSCPSACPSWSLLARMAILSRRRTG